MGGMNYHIEIEFEDGIRWLARIRRSNATSPPSDLKEYIMRSEVATLQFIFNTKFPAPKVFDYNFDSENPIGVGVYRHGEDPRETSTLVYCFSRTEIKGYESTCRYLYRVTRASV